MAQNTQRSMVRTLLTFTFVFGALFLAVTAPGSGRAEAAPSSTLAQYRAWMVEARQMYPYPQSVDKMYRVMMCESSGNAKVVGSGRYHGLFQYVPSTWRGKWNPYRTQNIYDAKAQIFATAKAWSIGMQRHWGCYFYTPGR